MNSADYQNLDSPADLDFDKTNLIYEDWGLIPYEEALSRQIHYLETVRVKMIPGYLIFCTHPPIVTLGRATQRDDIFSWEGPQIQVARGGRATYHGPSQLMIYPILNLNFPRRGRQKHEVQGYLRSLETSLCRVLLKFGIEAIGKSAKAIPTEKSSEISTSLTSENKLQETGVWVEGRKIASLGIGVRNWITYHGAALNLDNDPEAFQGINPCGFSNQIMTNVANLLNSPIDREKWKYALKEDLMKIL